MNIEVQHYKNGNIKSIIIRNEKGKLHNIEGPSVQAWYENRQERVREYWVDGELHNTERPACQEWDEDGGQEVYRMYWLKGMPLPKEEWEKKVNSVEIECEGKTVTISRESAKALNLKENNMAVEVKHYDNGNIVRTMINNDRGRPCNAKGKVLQEWYYNGQEYCRVY